MVQIMRLDKKRLNCHSLSIVTLVRIKKLNVIKSSYEVSWYLIPQTFLLGSCEAVIIVYYLVGGKLATIFAEDLKLANEG